MSGNNSRTGTWFRPSYGSGCSADWGTSLLHVTAPRGDFGFADNEVAQTWGQTASQVSQRWEEEEVTRVISRSSPTLTLFLLPRVFSPLCLEQSSSVSKSSVQ